MAVLARIGHEQRAPAVMELTPLELPGACLLTPRRFSDPRGYFVEHYNRRTLAAHGVNLEFLQDNVSYSQKMGTIRGLHFQPPPVAQTKLVGVLHGAVLDVLVDIRVGSPTFGRHVAVELSADNGIQALVPRGFAHGFCTLTDDTVLLYKVDAHYDAANDLGLLWCDPDLGIRWPVADAAAILIERDRRQPRLRDLPAHFHWEGA
jgi:dTDP-4-dehydrorhamnose 3,5-epimerase